MATKKTPAKTATAKTAKSKATTKKATPKKPATKKPAAARKAAAKSTTQSKQPTKVAAQQSAITTDQPKKETLPSKVAPLKKLLSKQTDGIKVNVLALAVVGVLVWAVSGYLWWSKVYSTPERVFWAMIGNNLSTKGVTRTITQDQGGAKITQRYELNFAGQMSSRNFETIDGPDSKVETEALYLLDNDYVRFNEITKKTKDDQSDPTKAIGKWAKIFGEKDTSAGMDARTQSELALAGTYLRDRMFYGNLSAGQRMSIVNSLKGNNVYTIKNPDARMQTWEGHKVYRLDVDVLLLDSQQLIVDYLHTVGLPKAAQYVKDNGLPSGRVDQLRFTIDVFTHQLLHIEPLENNDAKESVRFGEFGVPRDITKPESTIDSDVLRSLLGA